MVRFTYLAPQLPHMAPQLGTVVTDRAPPTYRPLAELSDP